MSALDASERARHSQLIQEVLTAPGRLVETDIGYRREFETVSMLPRVAEWIALEHRCCPFLSFTLQVDSKRLWLELAGPSGTKDFLKAEFGLD